MKMKIMSVLSLFFLGLVGSDGQALGDGTPCIRDIPIPFSLLNQKVELAPDEHYLLVGRVVVVNGQPAFQVDLGTHPWLATEFRKAHPVYAVVPTSARWLEFEGEWVRVVVRAEELFTISKDQKVSREIRLRALAEPERHQGDETLPSRGK